LKKKVLSIAGLFALLVVLASAPSVAQTAQDPPSSSDQAGRQLPSPEEVVARLDEKLSLSDDQKARITPIIADRQQKLKALAADSSGRRYKKARKMKEIFSESDEKIKAVLNDEQKQKYAEMEQQMREEFKQRRQQRADSSSQ
jgi:hypothetical protein